MYIKIYFNNKPLFLTDTIDSEIEPFLHHDDAVFMDELSNPAINSMLHEMRQENVHAGVFFHTNTEALKKAIWKKFTIVQAAGGLVRNDNGEILFMNRRRKWDLPKGKLDKGETLEQCAVRETIEETGLQTVQLKKPIITTFHTYDENGKHILKETHWYQLIAPGTQPLVPQASEQIDLLEWVPVTSLSTYTKNIYPSVVDVLKAEGYGL